MRHSRMVRIALRLATAAFVFIILIYCGLRAYTVKLGNRSITLLNEAARIQIGASEDSILPLATRYSGVKWTPPPPGPAADCVDKIDCECENAQRPDYQYEIALSPFGVLPATLTQEHHGRIRSALTFLMIRIPSEWRDPFSLRDVWTTVDISIRAGRVVAVSGNLYVEGRNRWLGNSWTFSAEMPHVGTRSKGYEVHGTFLTFPGHGGAGTVHYLTASATTDQFRSAQDINGRCITGLFPCRCLSDLTPLAFQYLRRHPNVGSSTQTDDCPYRLNTR